MKKYDFYKDERVIYRERTNFSVKSKTYEDAVNAAKQFLEVDLDESDTISIDGCCFVENVGVPMKPEQNEGTSTVRIFNSTGYLIASNSDILQK